MMMIEEDARVIKSGTNLFKLIEFHIGNMKLGINLVKVKKLSAFRSGMLTKVFEVPEGVFGMMEIDGEIIPIIDLRTIFGMPQPDEEGGELDRVVIVTEFNETRYGFIVDHIHVVHRISWVNLQPVDKISPSYMVIAVASLEKEDILMVDFEMIIDKIFPKSIKLPDKEDLSTEVTELRKKLFIIAADDSKMIRKKLSYVFEKHNFPDVTICTDGKEAYDFFMEMNANDQIDPDCTLIVTDIEMPRMDGLTLCKKVKDVFKEIPVLVLSSLISGQFLIKCKEVNVSAALSKGNLEALIGAIDKLMLAHQTK